MKSLLVHVLSVFCAVCLGFNSAQADSYQLDDQHTSVVFAINHLGYSYCYGMFGKYSGKFEYDAKNPTKASFQFTIDAASLDTKSVKRDEHLRGPDFFNVKQFPDIKFVSKKIAIDGTGLNVTGDLTVHGVTKEIVLPLVYMGAGPAPDNKQHLGFMGKTTIKRSDFDMKAYLPHVGDDVSLMLSFEGIR
jgi:polyisoprenoid-binding protein YceI